MLEECPTEEQRPVVRFLWQDGLNIQEVHIAMFPVRGGKFLPVKAIHNWEKNISLRTSRLERSGRNSVLWVSMF